MKTVVVSFIEIVGQLRQINEKVFLECKSETHLKAACTQEILSNNPSALSSFVLLNSRQNYAKNAAVYRLGFIFR